jgi:CheY-like chemotaxis protein
MCQTCSFAHWQYAASALVLSHPGPRRVNCAQPEQGAQACIHVYPRVNQHITVWNQKVFYIKDVFGAAKTNGNENQVTSIPSSSEWHPPTRAITEIIDDSSAEAPVIAPAAMPRGSARHAAASTLARGLRVLMVDDSDIVRKVTGRMLEKLGCVVDYATNGSEAVRMCVSGEYDVVFMDCQMPIMDGPSAARMIRAERDASQPHIVAFTANILDENRRTCMEAGMDDFVTKPLDMDELASLIGSMV